MGILKFAGLLIRLLREMLFDHPDETEFGSPRFNARKMMAMTLMMSLFLYSGFVTERLYIMARDKKQTDQLLELQQNRQCRPIR